MKLIIDIPESEYTEIKRYYDSLPEYSTVEAETFYIAHGIPLDSVENKGEDRPKGHWIYPSYPNNYPYMWKYTICSNCNTGFPTINKDYKFCPECGADMRGET